MRESDGTISFELENLSTHRVALHLAMEQTVLRRYDDRIYLRGKYVMEKGQSGYIIQ